MNVEKTDTQLLCHIECNLNKRRKICVFCELQPCNVQQNNKIIKIIIINIKKRMFQVKMEQKVAKKKMEYLFCCMKKTCRKKMKKCYKHPEPLPRDNTLQSFHIFYK